LTNKSTIDEGFSTLGAIAIIAIITVLFPLWGPVWLLGALKIKLFGHSPVTPESADDGGW
jgi:hypothetical protein